MNKISATLATSIVIVAVLLPTAASFAQTAGTTPNINDPQGWVCISLANIGMPCASKQPAATTDTPAGNTTANASSSTASGTSTSASKNTTTEKRSFFGALFAFIFGSSDSSASGFQTATIIEGFGGRVNHEKDAIILVQVPGDSDVYRIMGGKKFLIPRLANDVVFDSYGFNKADIIPMSREQLATYPRVKFVTVAGTSSKVVYYLTESKMLRRIPNKKVFYSYADVDHDIAVIDSVEFSLYPKNQFIFNEETRTAGQKPQVYLISNNNKQAIDYGDLFRLGVTDNMLAPVNQTEFDSYKTLEGSTVLLNSSATPQTNSSPSQNITTQYN